MIHRLPEEFKKKVVVREKSDINPSFGCEPSKRPIENILKNGLVLVDKPYGPTSHQVSAWVRDLFGLKKTGHAGTLDPHVTGILTVALGPGTKILQALSGINKEYVCLMELKHSFPLKKVEKVGQSFVGPLEQLPPKMAAVKRRKRWREIHYLEILEVLDNFVLFRVGCEKGFYVRVFCEQFGRALGSKGLMVDLRRTKAGCYSESELISLQYLCDEYHFFKSGKKNRLGEIVYPIEKGIEHLSHVIVKDSAIDSLCHGASLGLNGISKLHSGIEKGNMVAVVSLKGELVALGTAQMTSQEMLGEKGIGVKVHKVFMERGVYSS